MSAVEEISLQSRRKTDVCMTSILIVDSDQLITSSLQTKLKKTVTLVDTAENTEEAEILLQRCHFDLIIINIPPADDIVLKWINSLHEKGYETGVIFMASDAALETAINAFQAGASDFILKPFNDAQMMAATKKYFAQKKIKQENFVPRRQIDNIDDSFGIVGNSKAINNVCRIVKRIAPMPSTVLIEGESGTGKELVARAIHKLSNCSGSFVPVNCGGMSAELLESELFGHTKGAFTGAIQSREGLFSYANHGTLFLDEISEMPLLMQAHLLRVLEERSIRAVGSNQEVSLDVRIIAATNKDLKTQVKNKIFREDLYYRLNVLALYIPCLHERMEDVPLLAKHFISTLSAQLGMESPFYDESELNRLQEHSWPGNVRELKNVIERCLLLGTAPGQCMSGIADDNPAKTEQNPDSKKLEYIEKQHILKVLAEQSGNKSASARVLGISRKTLERKVQLWDSQ